MIQPKPPGVQHQPSRPGPIQSPFPVDRVSQDGMPQMVGHVHPNLMGPSRVNPALHQGGPVLSDQNFPIRQGGLSLGGGHDRHLLTVPRVAPNPVFDPPAIPAHRARDRTEIFLSGLTGGEGSHQGDVSLVGLRHRQTSAGVLVQAVNDAGPLGIPDLREFFSAMLEQPLHQRSGGIARARVDTESFRFVQDQKVFILEENVQAHRLTR